MAQYDFDEDAKKRIRNEIIRRWQHFTCPRCGGMQLEIADGFVDLPLLSNYWQSKRSSGLPSAALVCATCGYTMLFNLVALGLRDLIGPDPDEYFKRMRTPRG